VTYMEEQMEETGKKPKPKTASVFSKHYVAILVCYNHEDTLPSISCRDRPVKTYMEEQMEETGKKPKPKDRKKEKLRTRGTPSKKVPREESVPEAAPIEGAHARVCEWGGGRGLSKKDAAAFVKAVKKFGDESQLDMIAEEVRGEALKGSFVTSIFRSVLLTARCGLFET
jgi:chromodomain-helicase-DNA-binding protein 1